MIHREQEIIQWAVDRNILGPTGEGTMLGQLKKTEEEVAELRTEIELLSGNQSADLCRVNARDAIGDIIVTLAIQAQLWDLDLTECIEAAWNEIKDRKGRMVNGIFVKET